MTDASWDAYIDTDDPSTAVPEIAQDTTALDNDVALDPSATEDEQLDTSAAASATGDAAQSQSWSDWNSATGDENVDSANSYAASAAQEYSQGDTELGDQYSTDAQNYADAASTSYGAAADNDSDTAYSLNTASNDLGDASTDATESYSAPDTSTGADESSSYDSSSYDTADTSSYADDDSSS